MTEYAIFVVVVACATGFARNAAAFFAPRPRIVWCEPHNEDF